MVCAQVIRTYFGSVRDNDTRLVRCVLSLYISSPDYYADHRARIVAKVTNFIATMWVITDIIAQPTRPRRQPLGR